jgi:endoglycosylceramidase
MKKILPVLLTILVIPILSHPALAKADNPPSQLALHTDGLRFVDAAGREVILRGANTGGRSKLPPFFPFEPVPDFDSALEKYADSISALGFNVVRLLIIYEAAEPTRGKYDEAYLKQYDRMVAAFGRRGIRVMVDAHQDLFSRRFCGDGFPDWTLPEKYRGLPQHADCKNWGLRDFTWPVADTLEQFWSNRGGVQDNYIAFFKMLAERYREDPMVIGFEPINEPFPGTIGRFSLDWWYRHQLFPLYEKAGQAVQSVNPRYLIFADMIPLENIGMWTAHRPRPSVNNLVFAPHYYDFGTFGIGANSQFEQAFMSSGLARHSALQKAWDTPILIGEFGASPLMKGAAGYLTLLYNRFDELKFSGTYWECSMSETIWNLENTSCFNPDGSLRPAAAALDRPYPRAVAGKINRFSFDAQSGKFELTWDEDPRISLPTEIYLPARIYSSEPKINLEPSGRSELDPSSRILSIDPLEKKAERKIIIVPR